MGISLSCYGGWFLSGRYFSQSFMVPLVAFLSLSLIVLFILSTTPELYGWYGMCSFHCIPNTLVNSFTSFEVNAGPWSEYMVAGSPYRLIQWLIRHRAAMPAVSPVTGMASGHIENLSTITHKYLRLPLCLGMCVKSICKSCSGPNGGGKCPCFPCWGPWTLFWAQVRQEETSCCTRSCALRVLKQSWYFFKSGLGPMCPGPWR